MAGLVLATPGFSTGRLGGFAALFAKGRAVVGSRLKTPEPPQRGHSYVSTSHAEPGRPNGPPPPPPHAGHAMASSFTQRSVGRTPPIAKERAWHALRMRMLAVDAVRVFRVAPCFRGGRGDRGAPRRGARRR